MYAVIGTAKLDPNRADEAIALAKAILARGSEVPGFVSGTFMRSEDGTAGRSVMIFDSEEAAKGLAERAPSMIPADGPTELLSLDLFNVVDHR